MRHWGETRNRKPTSPPPPVEMFVFTIFHMICATFMSFKETFPFKITKYSWGLKSTFCMNRRQSKHLQSLLSHLFFSPPFFFFRDESTDWRFLLWHTEARVCWCHFHMKLQTWCLYFYLFIFGPSSKALNSSHLILHSSMSFCGVVVANWTLWELGAL